MGDETTEQEPDLELLTRKIAKCDRLLKKKGTPKDTIAKLKRKRADYVLQLGELAYRAAQASTMNLGASPTTVTEKLDPARFQQFNDSLAVFEHSINLQNAGGEEPEPVEFVTEDVVSGQEEEDVDTEPISMSQILQDLPAADDEDLDHQSESSLAAVEEHPAEADANEPVEATPEEKAPEDEGADDGSEMDAPASIVEDDENNDKATAVPHVLYDAVVGEPKEEESDAVVVDDNYTHDGDDFKGNDEAAATTTPLSTPEEEMPTSRHRVVDEYDILGAKDGDSKGMIDDDQQDHEEPAASDGMLMGETSAHTTSTEEGSIALESTSGEDMGSPSNSYSKHPATEPFDGEGSVGRLRAMFDSPTGEKPRRSWRPKKSFNIVPQAPLVAKDDEDQQNPIPPTVTMKVDVAHSTKSTTITLYQAVMTSTVHDIDSKIVALVSLFPQSIFENLPKQNRAILIFKALGIEPIYVDGSNPDEKERRNELFELSGKRGEYPQLFVRKASTGKLEFFADFDKIELLNDCGTLKEEIEAACR